MRNALGYVILNAKAATGAGNKILVDDFMHAVFAFDSADSANLTIKFQGSISDVAPDFAAAQSKDNQWDYIEVIDLEDGGLIDGDTGITLAGTDDNRQLEANINGLRWICARITARSAGSATLSVRLFENK